ncbi:MAG TPA: hypothetical protein EYH31_09655 [Anaerolineae bacterium]|nr:hypothetical protein [Anaerolineae bacterium]
MKQPGSTQITFALPQEEDVVARDFSLMVGNLLLVELDGGAAPLSSTIEEDCLVIRETGPRVLQQLALNRYAIGGEVVDAVIVGQYTADVVIDCGLFIGMAVYYPQGGPQMVSDADNIQVPANIVDEIAGKWIGGVVDLVGYPVKKEFVGSEVMSPPVMGIVAQIQRVCLDPADVDFGCMRDVSRFSLMTDPTGPILVTLRLHMKDYTRYHV